jgi:hypothetical protein
VSLDEHVTRVVPRANVDPLSGTHVIGVAPSTRSLADPENVTAAPADDVASATREDGSVNAGGVVSRTLTVKLPVAVFPEVSVLVQVTVVVPRANVEPDVDVQERTLTRKITPDCAAPPYRVIP